MIFTLFLIPVILLYFLPLCWNWLYKEDMMYGNEECKSKSNPFYKDAL